MVLSGHAGVKYGIPFPVVGRSAFGTNGVHIPAIIRGFIAAVWFGIQTWIGGISIYSIYSAISGEPMAAGLSTGHFVGFFLFWLLNVYFIWNGTESIKWLETFAAPILIIMGVALIVWGSARVGSFTTVLKQGEQLEKPNAWIVKEGNVLYYMLNPVKGLDNKFKATHYNIKIPKSGGINSNTMADNWQQIDAVTIKRPISEIYDINNIESGTAKVSVMFRKAKPEGGYFISKSVSLNIKSNKKKSLLDSIWPYLTMLTVMVGFWATMSISIADITRFSKTQADQIKGQFLGLPGTMMLYSFVGIFVTFAAVIIFEDILVRDDAPWDPAQLLSRFKDPAVVIVAQVFMIIATLSTNIAANVIAPANAFANAFPKSISFRSGGIITAIIGIIICPWWIINHIIPMLLFISSLLGPVVAILICDYFVIRKTNLNINELFKTQGEYSFGGSGFNKNAMIAFITGVAVGGIGYFVPALVKIYEISWFCGFFTAFGIYYMLAKNTKTQTT